MTDERTRERRIGIEKDVRRGRQDRTGDRRKIEGGLILEGDARHGSPSERRVVNTTPRNVKDG